MTDEEKELIEACKPLLTLTGPLREVAVRHATQIVSAIINREPIERVVTIAHSFARYVGHADGLPSEASPAPAAPPAEPPAQGEGEPPAPSRKGR